MGAAIVAWLKLMRKAGRIDDATIDKIKNKGHITNNDAKELKLINIKKKEV